MWKLYTFVLLAIFNAPILHAHAQAGQGQQIAVSGAVKDASGGVVQNASVEIVVTGRVEASGTTGADGRYRLEVPAGVPFAVQVRREGFADQVVKVEGTTSDVSRDVQLVLGRGSDTLVVTATRGTESRTSVTQAMTVATSEDLDALGATSLADVLRHVPGVSIEANGREGALTALFSRGGESDYNLVLVDGVRVNLNGGAFDFSRISAGEIDRVEVVRGAQSALWGSDALGSVVQIFTTRSALDRPQAVASLEGGSFGTFRGDTSVNGRAGKTLEYQGGIAYRLTDGAFEDILPENDRFEETSFNGMLGVTLGARAHARTTIRYGDAEGRSVGPITYGSRDQGTAYDTKNLSWNTSVSHTMGSRFVGTGTFNYFRYNQFTADTINDSFSTYAVLEGTPDALYPNGVRLVRLVDQPEFDALIAAGATPGPGQFLASTTSFDFPSSSTSKFRRPAIRYQGDYTWGAGQRLSAGYEWERESDGLDNGIALDNNAFFVQQQLTFADRYFATVGLRTDGKENYDTFVSPKLSAGAYLMPFKQGRVSSVKVFGNIGKGIKSPTFLERFGNPAFADPNPDLEVERAQTADVGVEATFADQQLRASLTYFNNDYKDQIAYRFGDQNDGIPEYINIDGSEANGWELEMGLQRPIAGFSALGSYAYVDTEVVTSIDTSQQFQPGQPLLRRPRHSGALRMAYTHGAATVNFDVRFVGRRHDNSFLFMESVPNAQYPQAFFTDITVNPGYTVAGLGIQYRFLRSVSAFLRVDNLGDTEYDLALGYPGLPRGVVVGARIDFGRFR